MAKDNQTKTSPGAKPVKTLGDVEFVVEQARTVPDGPHTGVVDRTELVERGEEGFRYMDVHIAVDGTANDDDEPVVIKCGFAASRITPETDLGHLLRRFGAPVGVGAKVNPVRVLAKGTKVAFDTETEKNRNGRFARVVQETLRPAPAAPKAAN